MKKEDILAICIDDIKSGEKTLEECMRLYPDVDHKTWQLLKIALHIPADRILSREDALATYITDLESGKSPLYGPVKEDACMDEEMMQLLAVAAAINGTKAEPSAEFRQRTLQNLAREMISGKDQSHKKPANGAFRLALLDRTFRIALTATVGLIIVISVGVTTAFASQSSLPGQPLYPVKKGMETMQFAMAQDKADVQLKLAQRRVEEIGFEVEHGMQLDSSTFESYRQHVSYVIEGLKYLPGEEAKPSLTQLYKIGLSYQMMLMQALNTAPAEQKPALENALQFSGRQLLLAQTAFDNPAILKSQLSITSWDIEGCYFRVNGVLKNISGKTWDIGGLKLANVNSVSVPDAGMLITARGLSFGDEVYISRWEYQEGVREGFQVEGMLNISGGDGNTWSIGGITLAKPQNLDAPAGLKMAYIEGVFQDNFLSARHSEFRDMPSLSSIQGVITGWDGVQKMITVEVAGARLTLDVSNASLTGRDNLPMALKDLERANGRIVELRNVNAGAGKLAAGQLILESSE